MKGELTEFVFLYLSENLNSLNLAQKKKHRSRQYRLKCYSMQASCLEHKIKVTNVMFRDCALHQWNVR